MSTPQKLRDRPRAVASSQVLTDYYYRTITTTELGGHQQVPIIIGAALMTTGPTLQGHTAAALDDWGTLLGDTEDADEKALPIPIGILTQPTAFVGTVSPPVGKVSHPSGPRFTARPSSHAAPLPPV
ncbi:hypothetical protein ACQP1G_20915 [Nocardia sp. CA-107356]|uniref:hypothetical protein n=1 Tax=Nocardia sp. CA-107356 TaxID=3239972 RepID=UPI003D9093FF